MKDKDDKSPWREVIPFDFSQMVADAEVETVEESDEEKRMKGYKIQYTRYKMYI